MSNDVYKYPERGRQLVVYSGLLSGSLSPTDIDGLIEYKGIGYIFIEVKVSGVLLPFGQNLAFERLCDDLGTIKPTCYIVAEHGYPTTEDILLKECTVRSFRFGKKWNALETKIKVGDFVKAVLQKYEEMAKEK